MTVATLPARGWRVESFTASDVFGRDRDCFVKLAGLREQAMRRPRSA